MKALALQENSDYPTLSVFPEPEEEVGMSIVEVKAAALNHRDIWICKRMYPGLNFPIILGSDACGSFEGSEVVIQPGWRWGTEEKAQSKDYHILGSPTHGTFAQFLKVGSNQIYPKPSHLSYSEGGALPLAGLTAYRVLFKRCHAKTGEKILITGIGGGVALLCCQFALAQGLEVFVTSGKDWKIDKAIDMGVKAGVNYKNDNWLKELELVSGGVDIIIDSAAGEDFSKLLKICNQGARIGLYGGGQGNIQKLSPQLIFWRQLSILGSTMGSDRDFSEMLDFVNFYKVVPIIDSIYSLKDSKHAFKRLENEEQFGKVVLDMH